MAKVFLFLLIEQFFLDLLSELYVFNLEGWWWEKEETVINWINWDHKNQLKDDVLAMRKFYSRRSELKLKSSNMKL